MFHGYFDESGDFEQVGGVFCLSGYFLGADAARAMDANWRAVLADHDIAYFHMVDCAHGNGVFEGKSKDERIEIQRKLIHLIKSHTLEGYSVIAHADVFQADDGDIYSYCARTAVVAVRLFLKTARVEDDVTCFFESGHRSAGRAYNKVAAQLPELGASVKFGGKEEIPLLQAADLLAWHCTKYVKDRKSNARQPRRDFLSLMEHPHSFAYLFAKDAEKSIGIELWPINRRSQETVGLKVDYDGPVVFMREDGDDAPIVLVSETHGWRLGGARMTYVAFSDFKANRFYLGFDTPRLIEASTHLMDATSEATGGSLRIAAPASEISIERTGELVVLRVRLTTDGQLEFRMPAEAFEKFRQGIQDDDSSV